MGNGDEGLNHNKFSVFLIGVGSAALVLSIYHCISIGWCRYRERQNVQRSEQENSTGPTLTGVPANGENSIAELIPAHKYMRSDRLTGEDGTCAVCLSEFEEGEELRTLPECQHSYHAACIDMWLYSHSNCPMCRADATPSPSPQIYHEPASEDSPEQLAVGMARIIVLPSSAIQYRVT